MNTSTEMTSDVTSGMTSGDNGAAQYDVAIIGGGLAGAMAALMMERRGLSCVVLESRPEGREQKIVVGEAITEGTSVFFRHELGLEGWLKANVFRKFGFDFITLPRSGPPPQRMEDCHEMLLSLTPLEKIPGALQRLIPTYHVERTSLNAHVASEARSAGAKWMYGASVEQVNLGDSPTAGHEVHYSDGAGTPAKLRARFVIDASGRRCVLGRQLGITHPVATLDTAAVWNRFDNVNADPSVWRTFHGVDRRRHTIHFTGPGFWIWWIHQSDHMTSVGVSWDRSQHQPDVKTEDRGFWEMIRKFPVVADLLENARPLEPYQYYAHLPYQSDHWIDTKGYALIGDAAWFTDALYSVGVETACRMLSSLAPLVVEACRGAAPDAQTYARLNEEFEYAKKSVLKMNEFKYQHGWARPHIVAQTAVYELGDITELYHMTDRSQWTAENRARWYHLPWYTEERYRKLSDFLDGSLADGDRDLLPGAKLVKKALLPGPLVYLSTWPLWRNKEWTYIFFKIIRMWSYSERRTQRSRFWPDALGWMASSRDVKALMDGALVGGAGRGGRVAAAR